MFRVRLCGDYNVTVNKELDIDLYSLPRPEDLTTSLTGGQNLSKPDLSAAYQQMPLVEESHQFVMITTHQGLFLIHGYLSEWHLPQPFVRK